MGQGDAVARAGPGNETQGCGLGGCLTPPGQAVGSTPGFLSCGGRTRASLPSPGAGLAADAPGKKANSCWVASGALQGKREPPLLTSRVSSWRKLGSWEGQRAQAAGLVRGGGQGYRTQQRRLLHRRAVSCGFQTF